MSTLQELVSDLIAAREGMATMDAEIAKVHEEMAATQLGQRLACYEETREALRAKANETEAALREEAVSVYRATGDKKPAPGVGIRVMTRKVYSEKNAIVWCRTYAPVCIKEVLDKKAFEALSPEDIVTIQEEPTATIAKDLSGD